MLMEVYDPAGEMFEVRPELAKRLVIEQGWSLDKPIAKELPLFAAAALADDRVDAEEAPADAAPL